MNMKISFSAETESLIARTTFDLIIVRQVNKELKKLNGI